MKLRMQQLFEAFTTATNPGVLEFYFECLKFLQEGRHEMCFLCGLAFELSGRRRCDGRPARPMIDKAASRA